MAESKISIYGSILSLKISDGEQPRKLELIQTASEGLIVSLLPVIDDFERAEKALMGAESKELEGFQLFTTNSKSAGAKRCQNHGAKTRCRL